MAQESDDFLTLDMDDPDVRHADSKLGELIDVMHALGPPGDLGQELDALRTARQHIRGSKQRRDLIEALLVKPLRQLEDAPSERIKSIASECLKLFLGILR